MTYYDNPKILRDMERIRQKHRFEMQEVCNDTLQMFKESKDFDIALRTRAATELMIRECGFCLHQVSDEFDEENAVKAMHGRDSEGKWIDFSYTSGLTRLGLPEMLCFCPSGPVVHEAMHQLYDAMLDRKVIPPSDPDEWVQVKHAFGNYPLVLTHLNKNELRYAQEEHTLAAERGADVVLLHIPTKHGDWPHELVPEALRGYVDKVEGVPAKVFSIGK